MFLICFVQFFFYRRCRQCCCLQSLRRVVVVVKAMVEVNQREIRRHLFVPEMYVEDFCTFVPQQFKLTESNYFFRT